jgi:hypothetical protein
MIKQSIAKITFLSCTTAAKAAGLIFKSSNPAAFKGQFWPLSFSDAGCHLVVK